MRADPYIAVTWRQRRNRARAEGAGALLRGIALPLVAGALLVPLVRPTFLAFLDEPVSRWDAGVRGVVLRAALLIVGGVAIDLYGALVRGEGRGVLALLPVDAAKVARAEVLRVALDRWWILPGAALVLSPIAFAGAPALWAAALAAIASCAVLALGGSALAHLLAVEIAESPRWAPLLDLLRGSNPRAQAAFLYAPGAVLVLSGALLQAASAAVPGAAAGDPAAAATLALPALAGFACGAFVPAVARRAWFRASAVIADIDARYAILVDPAEARGVYLDWTVRFLPERLRPYALDDLRHGWRTRRTLVTFGWLGALLAAGVGWTTAPTGPTQATGVAVGAVFLCAANGVLLARDVPRFLRVWLPVARGPATLARLWVLALWTLPPVVLATLAVLLRRGVADAIEVGALGLAAVAVAGALAVACGRLHERGLAIYAPVGAVLAALLVAVGTVR